MFLLRRPAPISLEVLSRPGSARGRSRPSSSSSSGDHFVGWVCWPHGPSPNGLLVLSTAAKGRRVRHSASNIALSAHPIGAYCGGSTFETVACSEGQLRHCHQLGRRWTHCVRKGALESTPCWIITAAQNFFDTTCAFPSHCPGCFRRGFGSRTVTAACLFHGTFSTQPNGDDSHVQS